MEDVELPNSQTRILFDVFLTDPLIVDQFTYKMWLQGFSGTPLSYCAIKLIFCRGGGSSKEAHTTSNTTRSEKLE